MLQVTEDHRELKALPVHPVQQDKWEPQALMGPLDLSVFRVLQDLLDPRVPQDSRALQDFRALTASRDH